MPGYLVPTNTVDQSTTIGGYNILSAVDAGAVLQVVSFADNTSNSTSDSTNFKIYTQLSQSITTSGNSKVYMLCSISAIQTSTGQNVVFGKVDYNNTSTATNNYTNLVGGAFHEYFNGGYSLNTMVMQGITPTLSAGTYTFRPKIRPGATVNTQWNWHGYTEQRSTLTLMEIAA
jgi:hypothetical protein